MNDERLGQEIGEFYRETDVAPPDSKESARQVASRMSQTPQVARLRWLPSWLQRSTGAPAFRRTPHDPTPEVTGRTRTMLSPASALTAGALVFAIGGAFLIAQPFGQEHGSVPGAEAGASAPTRVTGRIGLAPRPCTEPDSEQDGAVRRDRNRVCGPMSWVASDPRLSGRVTLVESEDVYQLEDEVVTVTTVAEFLSNDEGAWTCLGGALYEGVGSAATYVGTPTSTCTGQGGFEGLSAILVFDTEVLEFSGFIFPGDFPPTPERPAAE